MKILQTKLTVYIYNIVPNVVSGMLPYLDGAMCEAWSPSSSSQGLPPNDPCWYPAKRSHLWVLQQGGAGEPVDEREDKMESMLHRDHCLHIPAQPQEREKQV